MLEGGKALMISYHDKLHLLHLLFGDTVQHIDRVLGQLDGNGSYAKSGGGRPVRGGDSACVGG